MATVMQKKNKPFEPTIHTDTKTNTQYDIMTMIACGAIHRGIWLQNYIYVLIKKK